MLNYERIFLRTRNEPSEQKQGMETGWEMGNGKWEMGNGVSASLQSS